MSAKLTLAVVAPLLGALLVAGCGQPSGKSGAEPAASAPNPAAAALPAPYNTADLDHGKALFAQCRSCHTIAKDGANMTGPNLHGLFDNRQVATHPDFKYSDALKAATFTWDAQHLNDWIAAPRTYMPGTKMTFLGFTDPKDRTDVIAYLMLETAKP